MARYALVVVLCLGTPVSAGVWGQATGGGAGTRFVDIDGHRVRVRTLGAESSSQGTLVVFEAGASNSLGVWDRVLPEVAAFAPTLAYDRAGLGESEWDDQAPTPQHVADRLRRVLASTGAKPPYVLVGYSWGGILIRYFAGLHPSEVAGLVFVDPAPLVTESLADNLAPFEAVGAGRTGYDAYWSRFRALLENAAPPVRAEFDVFRGLMEADLDRKNLRPLPAVPVVVIVAAKYLPLPALQLPFDASAHFDADVRQRSRILQEWALASPRGTLVVSNHATHLVPREDPALITWAVRRVLDRPRP